MKSFFSFLFFLLPIAGIAGPGDTLVRGVSISAVYSKAIFPASWQAAPISADAQPIDPAEVNRSIQVTIIAVRKYPEEVLKENLRSVFWVRKMSFYNVGYGGTNSQNALYLSNDGVDLGFTNKYLEQTFHHEFSSILLRNYPQFLDTTLWKKANEPGFDYNDPEDGVGAIRNNASSQDLDTLLCKRGLLTQYAMSSLENDVNTFAQNLFCPDRGFWKIADNFPRIRAKVKLLIDFYGKINPLFNEQFFRAQQRHL